MIWDLEYEEFRYFEDMSAWEQGLVLEKINSLIPACPFRACEMNWFCHWLLEEWAHVNGSRLENLLVFVPPALEVLATPMVFMLFRGDPEVKKACLDAIAGSENPGKTLRTVCVEVLYHSQHPEDPNVKGLGIF